MMKKAAVSTLIGIAVAIALMVGASACGDPVGLDDAPRDIRAFVRAEVPAQPPRRYTPILSDRSRDLFIFSVSYGPEQDCPSGCFYSVAWGLKYGARTGWIEQPYESAETYEVFDIRPEDSYLYGEELRARLEAKDATAYAFYERLLARDPDVPRP